MMNINDSNCLPEVLDTSIPTSPNYAKTDTHHWDSMNSNSDSKYPSNSNSSTSPMKKDHPEGKQKESPLKIHSDHKKKSHKPESGSSSPLKDPNKISSSPHKHSSNSSKISKDKEVHKSSTKKEGDSVHMKNGSDNIKHNDKIKKVHNKTSDELKKDILKDNKLVSKHKSSSSEHKDKTKNHISDGKKDKHKSSEKSKENTDKLKEKVKPKTTDKPKENSDKVKESKKVDDTKSSHNKDKSKKSDVGPPKVKVEEMSRLDKRKKELLKEMEEDAAKKPLKKIKVEVDSDDYAETPKKPSKKVKVEVDSDEYDEAPKKSKASAKKKRKYESSEEEDDYDDYKKPSKKSKKIKKEKDEEVASPRKRGKKEEEQEVWKWWEEEPHEGDTKWRTLEHNGPVFAPDYERVPKSVKFYYDGKHMELSEVAEEVAGFYGRMLDHEYTAKDLFNKNFFKDWRKVMTPQERETIKDLKKCDFRAFDTYYKKKSEERKAMTKEEKLVIKKQNEEMTEKYGFCVIDGHKQKIGNFKIEPPGLFRGRGEHPKMGMLKRRVQPEDILINIGKEAQVPKPPSGHKWKAVRHDNCVTWLASWNENILNSTKYIMLNPSSKLKGQKDWQKYETARKLKNHADRIRKTYTDDFKSKEMRVRQRAVALYFIDKLALRAGNEKDEDTADTVGCCSLRVEHITLDKEKDGQEYVVSFDFLGKDSIRYENSVAVEKRAFKNLKLFMENKKPGDDLFDRLNTGILNKYLTELMDGLTAKVFRTYNASKTLQEQLDLLTKEEMSIPEKILAYNRANRAVALLCNHQRAVPKTFDKSMENLKAKTDEKLKAIKECKKEIKQAKSDVKNNGNAKNRLNLEKKKKRLKQLEDQLEKLEVQATDKEENKQIALGTSKLNYLDPRISVAWCKKWDVPIEKIYNRTQRDKFRWAIEMVGPEFVF